MESPRLPGDGNFGGKRNARAWKNLQKKRETALARWEYMQMKRNALTATCNHLSSNYLLSLNQTVPWDQFFIKFGNILWAQTSSELSLSKGYTLLICTQVVKFYWGILPLTSTYPEKWSKTYVMLTTLSTGKIKESSRKKDKCSLEKLNFMPGPQQNTDWR